MASTLTGSGMSAALKQQQKTVRAAVEQRLRKAPGNVDREHHVAAFAIWDGNKVIGYENEQPSLHPKRRHEMTHSRYRCGHRDLISIRNRRGA